VVLAGNFGANDGWNEEVVPLDIDGDSEGLRWSP